MVSHRSIKAVEYDPYLSDYNYMNEIYKNITADGYDEDIFPGTNIHDITTNINEGIYSEGTYGELLPSSLRSIIQNYLRIDQDDVIYDLGSGVGKIVIQFAYETSAQKCVGIELGLNRYKASMEAYHNIATLSNNNSNNLNPNKFINNNNNPNILLSYNNSTTSTTTTTTTTTSATTTASILNRIQFIHGNILEERWHHDATILFINAFVFPDELMTHIENKIRISNDYNSHDDDDDDDEYEYDNSIYSGDNSDSNYSSSSTNSDSSSSNNNSSISSTDDNNNKKNKKKPIKYILLFGKRLSSDFMKQQSYSLHVITAPQSFSDDSNCELYIHSSITNSM